MKPLRWPWSRDPPDELGAAFKAAVDKAMDDAGIAATPQQDSDEEDRTT